MTEEAGRKVEVMDSRLSRVIRVVTPITLFVALLAWAFASPIGSSPDEDYHLASIWCAQGASDGICEPGSDSGSRKIPEILTSHVCYAFASAQSAECASNLSSSKLVETERGSFTGAYPPIYYWVMGLFVTGDPLLSVLLMRAFNALLLVATLLSLRSLKSVLSPSIPNWLIPTTFVPLGMFIVPSVSPSSWALTSAVLVLPSAYVFLRTRNNRLKVYAGFLVGIGVMMGAGSRGDSATYTVLALLLAVLLAYRKTNKSLAKLGYIFVLSTFSIIIFLSTGQSAILTPDATPVALTPQMILSNFATNIIQLPQLWTGVFGTTGLGWLDTPMPAIVWVTSLFVFSGVTYWSLKVLHWRKSVALLTLGLALVVVPMYIFVNLQVTVGSWVQARYIMPLIVMFMIVVLFNMPASLGLNHAQVWLVVTLAGVANAFALFTNMRRYISGLDVASPNLNNGVEWWWNGTPSPMFFWILGSLSFLLYVGLISGAFRHPKHRVDTHETIASSNV